MSFSASWLTLREPFDRRARNPAVLYGLGNLLEKVDVCTGLGPEVGLELEWRLRRRARPGCPTTG